MRLYQEEVCQRKRVDADCNPDGKGDPCLPCRLRGRELALFAVAGVFRIPALSSLGPFTIFMEEAW